MDEDDECNFFEIKNQLVVTVTDYGDELHKKQIKSIFASSVLKSVLKAMGGKFEVHSRDRETNFTIKVPCKY